MEPIRQGLLRAVAEMSAEARLLPGSSVLVKRPSGEVDGVVISMRPGQLRVEVAGARQVWVTEDSVRPSGRPPALESGPAPVRQAEDLAERSSSPPSAARPRVRDEELLSETSSVRPRLPSGATVVDVLVLLGPGLPLVLWALAKPESPAALLCVLYALIVALAQVTLLVSRGQTLGNVVVELRGMPPDSQS